MEGKPLLVSGARMHTLAGPDSTPAAVLLRRGRIEAVGTPAQLHPLAPDAERLDLPGATITPALTDAHVHLTEWALTLAEPELSAADSPHDAVAMVAAHPWRGPDWARGRGWNAHRWNGGEPTRQLLDERIADRPVALQSHDMHSLWVNTAALRAAGITAATPDPEGGRIVRDARGEPTGLLLERAGELVIRVIPRPSTGDVVAAVRQAQSILHGFGIAGVHSFPGIALPEPDPLTVVTQLREAGQLELRILQHIRLEQLDHAIALGLRSGIGDEWIRIGGVKFFLDGALGSRTAWMREPYENSASTGVPVLRAQEFRQHVERATRAGIAITVHAIGDAAVALALDVLSEPARRVPGLPHRIEHVQCCPSERLADAGRAGIVCSVQPCHLITDWQAADRHWGARRARCTYAFASLARAGATLAFGSDAPVEPIDPRRGLFAAVQRQDTSHQPADGWYAQERITASAALHGFTTGPALASGNAGLAGVIAPGALADLVAWDRDPLACEPAELLDLRPLATIVAGRVVHSA